MQLNQFFLVSLETSVGFFLISSREDMRSRSGLLSSSRQWQGADLFQISDFSEAEISEGI